MSTRRYKAFISYSHQDESWASWLHRALETYRIPGRLVGSYGTFGPVPRRLSPVFRDRDELSSSPDLNARVRDVLEDSESLVVVCSPAAAQSRWVNEEIRLFRLLGRGDRIFCIIVDGDPQSPNPDETCFPPALLETSVGETHEPLAADARKWADGKQLAKLKLVSGILGMRLDDLRMREQHRKRKLQAMYTVATILALVLVVTTIVSRVKEKARRNQAETLVTHIVEISEDLNSVVDLETLRKIGERLQSYLETLDPGDLTPQSKKQVALVLRQLGEVSRLQGKQDEALEALTESREIIRQLTLQVPENNDYLFELGNAEFYVGNIQLNQGNFELTGIAFQVYADSARELVKREPDNPDWIMELSHAYSNQAVIEYMSGTGSIESALKHIGGAVDQVEKAISLAPDNDSYRVHYATVLAWAADTHLRACNLGAALESRLKSEKLAANSLARQPGDNKLKRRYAYALSGVASVQRKVGLSDLALQNLKTARDSLEELAIFDSENLDYRWGTLDRDARIFQLMGETGNLEAAVHGAASLQEPMREVLNLNEQADLEKDTLFTQYLLKYSELLWRSGDSLAAAEALDQSVAHLTGAVSTLAASHLSRQLLAMARFLWWEQHGEDLLETQSQVKAFMHKAEQEKNSCIETDLAARTAILEGDRNSAQERVEYLLAKGYFEPGFVRFCTNYGLCGD